MAEVLKMPRMSDTMTEGVIVQWVKKVGDKVKSGDVLAEVETDKATMDLESYSDGVLLHIGVEAGNAVAVDGVIAIIGKEGEAIDELLKDGGASAAPAEPKKEEKEAVATADNKAAEPEAAPAKEAEVEEASQEASPADGRVLASPLAKRIAKEKGIEIAQLKGSGDHGRVVKRDVESYTPTSGSATKDASVKPSSSINATGVEGFEDVKVSQMRKAIAKRLSESKFTAPHFYLTMEVDMTAAMELRKAVVDALGVKISYNDMIVKASAMALTQHPDINASWLGDKIRKYQHVHIGVAVAVEDGLLVPVIRHADQKNMRTIAEEVKYFAGKAKDKKLQPDEYAGNTFTISNLGMYGIEEFTAIINTPDACILAVGAIVEKPVVKGGSIVVGNTMKLTLSCDHRVVDGAKGSEFLRTLKQYLETPGLMLA